MNTPIKRHKSLQPVSRDHHQGLLLCWKIRQGIKNATPITVIHQYTKWFYLEHLVPHFEIEEKFIFPFLGMDNDLIKQAMKDHSKIKVEAEKENISISELTELANLIENHIRFEERVLFNEIQKIVSDDKLNSLNLSENEKPFCENSKYNFWN